ncbi:MAG TPA: phage tail sheath subtilisin-like domain-containing protein [Paludibacteraceae bacterium]|nr:phage tail sheath subtilisin-like domain-containing protein [Paludibacteraceae bacterium]HPH62640.1 phage tail sheath subtilisin-like domain-containing protein [Paludibacteraceae bacterium]HQF50764.1 phage tail sheath subtilisin-like domain-containing protein [Paludibacteraceae bacterium]
MGAMKTPGVYIVEKNAFSNSTVEVATAVPAFIGYTEKAANGNVSLLNKPFRISSMAEFHAYFGGTPKPEFIIADAAEGDVNPLVCGGKSYKVSRKGASFSLYYQMLLFFANGGGPCYIVSVGNYSADEIDGAKLSAGVDTLLKEQEPTMVLCPEAVALKDVDACAAVQQAMLTHCGYKMQNRIAIVDVFDGFKDRNDPTGDVVNNFREKIGSNYLDYATAYYPWVNTSIVQERDLCFENLDEAQLKPLLTAEIEKQPDAVKTVLTDLYAEDFASLDDVAKSSLHKTMIQVSPIYNAIIKEMCRQMNLLAPSAAMAGIYTMVDNTRGVWKAPANLSLNSVISPAVNLTNAEQEDLNVPLNGKALNAIRYFVGDGIKVWGARTLDGNSLDWRYINVRRTMIMLEESVKNAARAYVFEPNDASTWLNVRTMIQNFLNGIWKRGGLVGSTPDEAYSVHLGIGDTMTPEDILEGIMRVSVFVAISRPAEFIEITFQQKMQES